MTDPIFLDCCMKDPTFLTSRYMHICMFRSEIFRGCLFSSMNYCDINFVLNTNENWVQKNERVVYEWVNISDNLLYEWVRFFKDQVYEWGRFRSTGAHTPSHEKTYIIHSTIYLLEIVIFYIYIFLCLSPPPLMKSESDITKTRLFKYIENFNSKNWKFSDKKRWCFSYFCSKHRLWVLVRTASARRFKRVPTIYVFEQK